MAAADRHVPTAAELRQLGLRAAPNSCTVSSAGAFSVVLQEAIGGNPTEQGIKRRSCDVIGSHSCGVKYHQL